MNDDQEKLNLRLQAVFDYAVARQLAAIAGTSVPWPNYDDRRFQFIVDQVRGLAYETWTGPFTSLLGRALCRRAFEESIREYARRWGFDTWVIDPFHPKWDDSDALIGLFGGRDIMGWRPGPFSAGTRNGCRTEGVSHGR